MRFFVKATPATVPKSKNAATISTFLAVILVVMAVTQLLTYDKFVTLLGSYMLPFDLIGTGILAAVIIFMELLALPFLLRLHLSPAMRVVSMVAGWLVIGIWFVLEIWFNHPFILRIGMVPATNAGLLGSTVPLTLGWWTVLFVVALGVLAAWSAWGMWPRWRRR